jgi:hypothetical protein
MSTLKADTIQSTSGGAVTLTGQQAAKLTLHYDQYNGPTILSSYNVASVTDVGTGQWDAIPTSSFSSVDAIQCYSNSQPVSTNDGCTDYWRKSNSTASKLHMRHFENGTTFDSPSNANVAHGDLA